MPDLDDAPSVSAAPSPADHFDSDPFADPPDSRAAVKPAGDNGPPPPASLKATPPKDPVTGQFVSPKPKHSPFWLRKAREVGLAEDEAAAMEPAELQAAVRAEIDTRAALPREHRAGDANASPEPEPAPEPAFEVPDILNDGLKAVLKSLHDRIKALEGTTGTLAKSEQRRAVSEAERQFDAAFAGLKGYERFFGTGNAEDLQGTPELKRRVRLLHAAGVTANDAPAAIRAKVKAAAEELYPKDAQASAYDTANTPPADTNRLTPDQQRWLDGGVEKPGGRAPAPAPKGVNSAKRKFQELEAQRTGQGSSGVSDSNFDF